VGAINTRFSGFYQTKKPIAAIEHLIPPGKWRRKCDRLGMCALDYLLVGEQLRELQWQFTAMPGAVEQVSKSSGSRGKYRIMGSGLCLLIFDLGFKIKDLSPIAFTGFDGVA